MLKVNAEALTEKGSVKPAVRKVIREQVTELVLVLGNGTSVSLDQVGNSTYFGVIATDTEGNEINAKVELTINTGDYVAPAKAAAKESETIEIE